MEASHPFDRFDDCPSHYLAWMAEGHGVQQESIAARLHDAVLQNLYSLQLTLPALQAEEGARALGQITEAVQAVVRTLRPPVIDYGLAEALRSAALRWPGLDVRLDLETAEGAPHPSDLLLYRIAQEALSNVALHAGVAEATVRLRQHPDHRILEVEDAGRGFEIACGYAGWQGEGRYGLMRAGLYARALQGRLQITSMPGRGTRVSVQVPTLRTTPPA